MKEWESASVSDRSVYWRQKPPYTLFLPGDHRLVIFTGGGSETVPNTVISGYANLPPSELQDAKSKAVARLLSALELADGASLGVTLAQYGQARTTIVQRSRQLLTFSKALKRLDFTTARKALGVSADQFRHRLEGMTQNRRAKARGWRDVTADYGGAWLEWSWGIAPTIDDINAACAVLASDASHMVDLSSLSKESRASVSVAYEQHYRGPRYSPSYSVIGTAHYSLTGTARVKNPNRAIFDSLGLTDALGIAFEVIPWSFVLAWVSNVEVFLQNWSPARDNWEWNGDFGETYGWYGSYHGYWADYPNKSANYLFKRTYKNPLSQIPTVDFRFKPLRFGLERGANAVALLSTFLRGK